MLRRTLAILGLGMALLGPASPVSAQLSCFGDAEATRIQREQGLQNVTQAARASGLGTPLAGTVRLCAVNGAYVWEFNELGTDGRVQRRVVNASTGALVPGA
jgi:hypothetical protein